MSGKMAAFVGIGFEVVGLLIASVWVGGWLDTKFQLKGMATAGLVVLALAGWFVHIIWMLKRFEKDEP